MEESLNGTKPRGREGYKHHGLHGLSQEDLWPLDCFFLSRGGVGVGQVYVL